MPCLFVLRGPDNGVLRPLADQTEFTIGRSDEADLQLVDEHASRIHCRLTTTKEVAGDFGIEVTRWLLADAGSSNGTRIGAEVLTEPAKLSDGSIIGLGQTSIVFLQTACESTDEAQECCDRLGINAHTFSEHAWPLSSPSDTGTLNQD